MKIYKLAAMIAIMLMGLFMTGCDEEKDVIVIEGNIPIKTSTLYIVGDATPALWDVDHMCLLEQSEEDHLVFIYDGMLEKGEMKAYLTQGSWDNAPCVRPMTAGSPISKADNTEAFQLYTGGEDLKWSVKDSGHYILRFDLRNWTLTTTFLGY